MVSAGRVTSEVIDELESLVDKEDIIIDGNNSRYSDSIMMAKKLNKKGIHFLDVGTSGGQAGARENACLIIGRNKKVFKTVEPLFAKIVHKDGYDYMGESGSWHFVKMVHNGIEYGMIQAIGEGFDLLENSEFDLDYERVDKVWANGSIIEGLFAR